MTNETKFNLSIERPTSFYPSHIIDLSDNKPKQFNMTEKVKQQIDAELLKRKLRTTPENITTLNENEIFVFGSNMIGEHLGGAARLALNEFGAIWGKSYGLMNECYAIETVETLYPFTVCEIKDVQVGVDQFIDFAIMNPQLTFLVTEIGCGIAGFDVKDIASLFQRAINIENIHLPERFWDEFAITIKG